MAITLPWVGPAPARGIINNSTPTGGSADSWLRMQAAYDLAQARQHENQIDVQRYATA